MKSITLIIPVYNEEKNIESNLNVIHQCALEITQYHINILVIDDGSLDNSIESVKKFMKKVPNSSLLCLNRNFGKEAAIMAGLNTAINADACIVMDSDLQHPPALLKEIIDSWTQGYEVVEAVKTLRGNESFISQFSAKAFYAIFDKATKLNIRNQSDYKLLDQSVVKKYCDLYEQGRFFRGIIHWMNFSTKQIAFEVPQTNDNTSSWSRIGLAKYAISSITSFSSFPLHIVTIMGLITFIISFIMGGITLFDKLSGQAVDGFTTVILLILLIGSILMFSLGMIGLYIAKIYDEVKHRPAYIINHKRSKLKLPSGK